MTDPASRPRKALVIGAGPVGALTALSLHRRGWEVAVWDMREGEPASASASASVSASSRSDFLSSHEMRCLIADT
jgi:2-polyprenyl-6-methoxyphenol hydroxylase-like FAD-dependent oxidoreductase